jgi:hypothetical protein
MISWCRFYSLPLGSWSLLSPTTRSCLMPCFLASKRLRTKVSVAHSTAGHNEG